MNLTKKAVFLDRDGVLTHITYDKLTSRSFAPKTLEELCLIDGVIDALQELKKSGFTIIVVSNQPDIALGKIDEETRKRLELKFCDLIQMYELPIDGIYYCHHHPESINPYYARDCDCRKPKAGMLFRAEKDHTLDLSNSWMIGDTWSDIVAGKIAGCKTILLKRIWSDTEKCEPNHVTEGDLKDALDIILQKNRI